MVELNALEATCPLVLVGEDGRGLWRHELPLDFSERVNRIGARIEDLRVIREEPVQPGAEPERTMPSQRSLINAPGPLPPPMEAPATLTTVPTRAPSPSVPQIVIVRDPWTDQSKGADYRVMQYRMHLARNGLLTRPRCETVAMATQTPQPTVRNTPSWKSWRVVDMPGGGLADQHRKDRGHDYGRYMHDKIEQRGGDDDERD